MVSLKLAAPRVVGEGRRPFPRHHWRGLIEASCATRSTATLRAFHAITGVVSLKQPDVRPPLQGAAAFHAITGVVSLKRFAAEGEAHRWPSFHAITGVVSLKHNLAFALPAGLAGFPRHHWRGLIEAIPADRRSGFLRRAFHAITGVVSLKHDLAFALPAGLAGFPRHHWRGLIEAIPADRRSGFLRRAFHAITGVVSLKPES